MQTMADISVGLQEAGRPVRKPQWSTKYCVTVRQKHLLLPYYIPEIMSDSDPAQPNEAYVAHKGSE